MSKPTGPVMLAAARVAFEAYHSERGEHADWAMLSDRHRAMWVRHAKWAAKAAAKDEKRCQR